VSGVEVRGLTGHQKSDSTVTWVGQLVTDGKEPRKPLNPEFLTLLCSIGSLLFSSRNLFELPSSPGGS
jgi:hypothetical protein